MVCGWPLLFAGEVGKVFELLLHADKGRAITGVKSLQGEVWLPASGDAAQVHILPVGQPTLGRLLGAESRLSGVEGGVAVDAMRWVPSFRLGRDSPLGTPAPDQSSLRRWGTQWGARMGCLPDADAPKSGAHLEKGENSSGGVGVGEQDGLGRDGGVCCAVGACGAGGGEDRAWQDRNWPRRRGGGKRKSGDASLAGNEVVAWQKGGRRGFLGDRLQDLGDVRKAAEAYALPSAPWAWLGLASC